MEIGLSECELQFPRVVGLEMWGIAAQPDLSIFPFTPCFYKTDKAYSSFSRTVI